MKRYHDTVFWVHNTKVFLKTIALFLLVLFVVHLLICLGLVHIFVLDKYGWMVILKFIGAKIISNINPDFTIQFTNPDGNTVKTTAQIICNNESIAQMTYWILTETKRYLFLSSCVYALFPVGLVILFKTKPSNKKDLHIRGSKLVTTKTFNSDTKKNNDPPDLPFGTVKFPKSCQAKSTLLTGKPGVGKTVGLSGLLDSFKDRNERMIIYDFKGDYVQHFFDPKKDYIFNPYDTRGMNWTLFREIFSPLDIDAIASSLIPSLEGTSADPFWSDGGRDLFSSILFFLNHHGFHRNRDIWEMVSADGNIIAKNLKKTEGCEKGYRYVVKPNSKQSLSILAVIMQYCKCFEHMADATGEFSINSWVENGKGNIFITNNASVQDSLKPLLSVFIDLLARKILSMPDNTKKKTVFLLDEFTSLQKLPSLVKLLTLGRSKGVSCYLGTQSYEQIKALYGEALKESIINSCANQILFSVAGSNTAKEASAIMGESESIRIEKSFSTGSDYREGAAQAYRNNTEPILLPSEIMNLKDLECIVKFDNYSPVKSKLQYIEYPKKNEGFIMRPDLMFKDNNLNHKKKKKKLNLK